MKLPKSAFSDLLCKCMRRLSSQFYALASLFAFSPPQLADYVILNHLCDNVITLSLCLAGSLKENVLL